MKENEKRTTEDYGKYLYSGEINEETLKLRKRKLKRLRERNKKYDEPGYMEKAEREGIWD